MGGPFPRRVGPEESDQLVAADTPGTRAREDGQKRECLARDRGTGRAGSPFEPRRAEKPESNAGRDGCLTDTPLIGD